MGINTFCFEGISSGGTGANTSEAPAAVSSDPQLMRLKVTFRSIMIIISIIGVGGNILNLLTLRSPSLRTVPFKYIRALAVYDLISLSLILLHFLLAILRVDITPVIYYEVWVEDVLINSFLVAGLYVAVLLTIERYLLIRKPHKKSRLLNIENTVDFKIAMALCFSLVLHLPMALQNTAKRNPSTGRLMKGNNQRLLCREPYWTIFNYYKMVREFLRFFCVVLLMSLNIIIAKNLQLAKKNRRLLIKRTSMPDCSSELAAYGGTAPNNATPVKEKSKRDLNHLMKSFTEKRLTALMAAICLIFVIGNVPQMVVMVLQNEALEDMYSFQMFRNVANTLEVLNHCLNFFIFCAASSEYMRAFLLNNCRFIRRWLMRFPWCASFIHARRLNSQCEFPSAISDICTNTNGPNTGKRSTVVTLTSPQLGSGSIMKKMSCSSAIAYRDRDNLSPQQKRSTYLVSRSGNSNHSGRPTSTNSSSSDEDMLVMSTRIGTNQINSTDDFL
ncbi:7 transmembrane receptor (rhodopsin family) domain-containing protein [Ditylenchus destructor]|uniref:7 transmembrane receptor (Rhodopsin family) domain-containing protein n=1 Tax=Ditylenchus destructor TaxID=166010 RepID=A0AAD4NAN5_9BILA|nr:7 transmembrane receptor (rhodopsin family) domain-containing protein [Ditylenchus destructor]